MAGIRTTERDSKRFAARAERNRVFQLTARTGYAVSGLLHVMIGVIAIATAFGARARADQTGALEAIARVPAGAVLLWSMVVAVIALGLWQVARGIAVNEKNDRRRWMKRLSAFAQAIGFLVIGVFAGHIAIAGPRSGVDPRTVTARVLAGPAGGVLLVVVGLCVLGAGVYFVVKGVTRRFLRDLEGSPVPIRDSVELLGVVGHVAKGVALAVLGILIVVAAVTGDPRQAGGLDQVFEAIASLPFGGILVAAIGVGFVAYGVYCGFRARLAKL